MVLSLEDLQQFLRLHQSLMFFVNRRLKVLDADVPTPQAYSKLSPEKRLEVHKALLEHRELIDAFADENPFGFDEDDLEIIRSWKHLVSGTFYAIRHLQKHTIFLSSTEPVVAYGVVSLSDPLEVLLGPHLPRMFTTTLLPFKGRIVYDSILSGYNISFGGGIRRRLDQSYKEAKLGEGVITSLPRRAGEAHPATKRAPTKKRAKGAAGAGGSASPAREAQDKVVGLTDAFCREYLDDEYRDLCRKMAGVLARKRPSPLTRGKPESWAGGIVRVVGWVNFIDDPSQPDHMRLSDIDKRIGISEATGSAKSMAIRDLLRIRRFDPEWTLPSRMEQNPMAWMIQVNGLIVDARREPREVQEEAFRRGLIPYIPADEPDAE